MEESKCKHIMEYIMSSRVCKRCGMMERYENTVFSKPKKPKEATITAPQV